MRVSPQESRRKRLEYLADLTFPLGEQKVGNSLCHGASGLKGRIPGMVISAELGLLLRRDVWRGDWGHKGNAFSADPRKKIIWGTRMKRPYDTFLFFPGL